MSAAPAPSEPPAIEMIDAAVSRRSLGNAVEGVNWRVMCGDYWVVCGLQGAGKTGFLATAAGLQPVPAGRHALFGRDTAGLSDEELVEERRRVGLVFENGGRLFSQLTLAENVSLPLCYHDDLPKAGAEERISGLLEVMGLMPFARQTPGMVSHVWRQRAGLARALALQPELLLLDNPTAGMDPRQARWWFDILGQLSAGHAALGGKKITLVVAVGDLQPWMEQGRQFALLHRREWRLLGGRAEFANRAEPLMQELLAAEAEG